MADNEETAQASTTALLAGTRVHVPAEGVPLDQGVWYDDFARVKAEAEKIGRPMLAMWMNPGCGFCKRFAGNLLDQRFIDWMKTIGMYFWLGSADDPQGRSGPGWDFVVTQSAGDDILPKQRHYFPMIAVWQSVGGKVTHDFRASGRVFENETSAPGGVPHIIARIAKALTEPPRAAYVQPDKPAEARQSEAKQTEGGCGHGKCQATAVLKQIQRTLNSAFGAPAAAGVPSDGLVVRLNPELDLSKRMRILNTIEELGGHCPCQTGKTDATLCLCSDFRNRKEPGACKCGLFVKVKE